MPNATIINKYKSRFIQILNKKRDNKSIENKKNKCIDKISIIENMTNKK
mgnify:CR=1 FL=1